ncbi:hypothetical protein QZH41_000150, partial [Actinostola sp. cb2023]
MDRTIRKESQPCNKSEGTPQQQAEPATDQHNCYHGWKNTHNMATYVDTLCRKKPFNALLFSETVLARRLSKIDLTSLGVAATLGAGVYVITGVVARDMAGPAIVISFFVAGVASLLAALCYAEFASRVPKLGSAYTYSYVTIGELCAFVIGWNLCLEYLIGGASLARSWTQYLDSIIDDRIKNFTIEHIGTMDAPLIAKYPDFLAFFVTMLITIPLCLGVSVTSKANNTVTIINLIVITFTMLVGFSFANKQNWTRNFMPFGFSGVLAGAAICFFSFVGFDVIAASAEEAINPTKDLPISMMLTV